MYDSDTDTEISESESESEIENDRPIPNPDPDPETKFMERIRNRRAYGFEVQDLCHACQHGYFEGVKYLISKRYVSPQSANCLAFRKAIQYNQVEILEWMILDNIAILNVNSKDIQDWIFLQSSAYLEFLESQIKLPMDCVSYIMDFIRDPFPFSNNEIKKFIDNKVKCRIIQ
jgi:hypothetical protein